MVTWQELKALQNTNYVLEQRITTEKSKLREMQAQKAHLAQVRALKAHLAQVRASKAHLAQVRAVFVDRLPTGAHLIIMLLAWHRCVRRFGCLFGICVLLGVATYLAYVRKCFIIAFSCTSAHVLIPRR